MRTRAECYAYEYLRRSVRELVPLALVQDVHFVQSNFANAAALKHAGKVLRLRMSRIQRAQRSTPLTKLATKAQKARSACGASLSQAFQWCVHAKALHTMLEGQHGADFVAHQLGDAAADVAAWLQNPWLNVHCSDADTVPATVELALTALLGTSGVRDRRFLFVQLW